MNYVLEESVTKIEQQLIQKILSQKKSTNNTPSKQQKPIYSKDLEITDLDERYGTTSSALDTDEETKAILTNALNIIQKLKDVVNKKSSIEKDLDSERELREFRKLKDEKVQLEEVIESHLKFIDQLLSDKQQLNSQCELYLNEIKETKAKHERNINELKQRFEREFKTAKENIILTERTKTEKLIHQKALEIKEKTLKTVEPEIQKILDDNKESLRRAEEKFESDYKILQESIKREYEIKLDMIREQVMKERIEIQKRENENINASHQFEIERMKKMHFDEKETLRIEHALQVEKLESQKIQELDALRNQLMDCQNELHKSSLQIKDLERFIREIKHESKYIEEKHKNKDSEVDIMIKKNDEEKYKITNDLKANFEENLKIVKEKSKQDIRKIREDYKVLESINSDLNRQIQKCQLEINLLNETLRSLQDEHAIKDKRIIELEMHIENLKSDLETTMKRNEEITTTLQDELARERKRVFLVKNDVERSYQSDLDHLRKEHEEEINILNLRVEDMMKEHAKKIYEIEENHANDLEAIEKKVLKIVEKKDREINKLSEDVKLKESLIENYKHLLEKQREDLNV